MLTTVYVMKVVITGVTGIFFFSFRDDMNERVLNLELTTLCMN